MRQAPTNQDDVIDSRDVIERITELQAERDEAFEAADANWDSDESVRGDLTREMFAQEHWEVAHPSEADELKALESLSSEAEGYAPDWAHGCTLVRDSYFTDYAQELLQDCGDLPKDIPHYIWMR